MILFTCLYLCNLFCFDIPKQEYDIFPAILWSQTFYCLIVQDFSHVIAWDGHLSQSQG